MRESLGPSHPGGWKCVEHPCHPNYGGLFVLFCVAVFMAAVGTTLVIVGKREERRRRDRRNRLNGKR